MNAQNKNGKLKGNYSKKLSNRSIKKTLRHTFASMVFGALILVFVCCGGLQLVHHVNKRMINGPVAMTEQVKTIEHGINDMNTLIYNGILGIASVEEVKEVGTSTLTNLFDTVDQLEADIIAFDDEDVMEALPYVEALRKAGEDYVTFGTYLVADLETGNTEAIIENFAIYKIDIDAALDTNVTAINDILQNKEDLMMKRIGGGITALGILLLALAASCVVTSVFIILNLCSFMDGSIDTMLDSLRRISEGDLDAATELEGDNEFVLLSKNLATTIKNIKFYIEKEKEALSLMASKDMTATIEEEFVGDFAPMRDAVNDITKKYNEFLLSTRDAATDVSGAASNMSSVSQSLASASTQQAASVQELLAIIEDLNGNVEKVANAAKTMSVNSLEDNEQVVKGNEKMNELLEAMNQIGKSSKMISGIVDMIEEIARKTSMLSLNASIEAARAGEQGKGFAVVAEEIRSLAEASTEAVHKITDLVDSSLEAVEQGANIATDTAELFDAIVKNGESHVNMTQEISNDCLNQSQTLHSVMCGVQEIAATVESNSMLAEEVSATSEQLSSNAQIMAEELNMFRLRECSGKEA